MDEGVAHALLTCHDICPGKATARARSRARRRARARSRARAKSQPGAEQENSGMCVELFVCAEISLN